MTASDSPLERWPIALRDWLVAWAPEPARPWLAAFLAVVATVVVFASFFALLTLAERKLLGRFQNRIGPNRTGPFGLLQPLADGIKMCTKEDIVPNSADRLLHTLAPVVLVAFALMTLAVLPYGRHLVPVELETSVLYFFAAAAGSELAIFMAGWSSRNKFALLAAMRSLAQLISYELPLLLAVVPVVMATGTLSTVKIVESQAGLSWHLFTPWGLTGFGIFLLAALAETNRSPFDLPEAESELIAGHLTEYSGFKYALFFMAEYFGMAALCGMAVTLYLGGWQAPHPALEIVPSYLWFGGKVLLLLFVFIWVRATFLRLRIDQLTRLAWKFLVPLSLCNLLATAFWLGTASWTGGGQWGRWAIGLALMAGPYLLLGRGLSGGQGPRTYRYVES